MKRDKFCIDIEIETQLKLMCTEWQQFLESKEFRKSLLYAHDIVKKDYLEYWLIHSTVFNPPVVLDQKWLIEYYFTLLLKTNLRKIAFVLPSDHFMHMLASSMISKIHEKYGYAIELECFSRIEHARYWLLTPDTTQGAISAYG